MGVIESGLSSPSVATMAMCVVAVVGAARFRRRPSRLTGQPFRLALKNPLPRAQDLGERFGRAQPRAPVEPSRQPLATRLPPRHSHQAQYSELRSASSTRRKLDGLLAPLGRILERSDHLFRLIYKGPHL